MVKDLLKKKATRATRPKLDASVPAGAIPEPVASASPVPAPGASTAPVQLSEIEVLKLQLAQLQAAQASPAPAPKSRVSWPLVALGIGGLLLGLFVNYLWHNAGGGGGGLTDELTVLVVYESDSKVSTATDEQKLALRSTKVMEWLDSHCGKIAGAPAWRIFDKDVELAHDNPIWQKLMDKPRDSLPWLYMTGGGREISEAMVDGDYEDFIEQLERGK